MGIIGVMDPINFEYLENFLWPTKKGLEDKKENKTLLNVFFLVHSILKTKERIDIKF